MTAAPSATDDGDDHMRAAEAVRAARQAETRAVREATDAYERHERASREAKEAYGRIDKAQRETQATQDWLSGLRGLQSFADMPAASDGPASIAADLAVIKQLLALQVRLSIVGSSLEGDRDGMAQVEHDIAAIQHGDLKEVGRRWCGKPLDGLELGNDVVDGVQRHRVASPDVGDGGHETSPSAGADTRSVGERPGPVEEAGPGQSTPATEAAEFAHAQRVELIAAALAGSFTLAYAPSMDQRVIVVRAVLEAQVAIDEAIAAGTINPYPHGVICPDCGKWSDCPENTCPAGVVDDGGAQ